MTQCREPAGLCVVIADDDDAFCRRVVPLLGREGVVVLDEAPDVEAAIRLTADLAPDVVILSVDMPGLGNAEARWFAEQSPRTRVLALGRSAAPNALADAIEAGAGAYLLKPGVDAGVASIRVALALLSLPLSAAEEAKRP